MPRKQKKRRKQNHSAKSNAALAQKTNSPSELTLSQLERLLGSAAGETNAFLALEMFQTALDECQGVAAASSFENDDASRLWELRDGRSYLRALFGVASSSVGSLLARRLLA
ncbi:MAG: hypothetical protein HYV60_07330 [Planctomycetia bacterium]|nr:hypothetical protein [Planctomycetia bacterium]